MATINLGADPNMDLGATDTSIKPNTGLPATDGATPNVDIGLPGDPAKPAGPDSISINFTPKISLAGESPSIDLSPKNADSTGKLAASLSTPAATAGQPAVMNLEIKRADLQKAEETTPEIKIDAQPEKKGLLGGLFAKKPETMKTKPSSAWGDALDAPKPDNPGEIKLGGTTSAEIKPAAVKIPDLKAAPASVPDTKLALNPKTEDKSSTEKIEFFSSAALQEKSGGGSKLVENIATQKAKLEQPKMEELLGKKSTILEKSIEQEAQLKLKKKLRAVQFMAFFVTVVAVGVNGFLYYQLSPSLNLFGLTNITFDSNLRSDLFNLNENLRSTQTELNKYSFLTGQLYLNQFGYESTRFLDGVANLETTGLTSEKIAIQSEVDEAKTKMPDLLAGAQKNLERPIVVETFKTRGETATDAATEEIQFQQNLKTAIAAEKIALASSSTQNNEKLPPDQLAFFDNATKLVGNVKLVTNLKAYTVDAFKLDAEDYQTNADPAQRLAFKTYIDNLLASTKVNLATITNLRNSRIAWSDVIDSLERVTNQVNTEHNSGQGIGNASKIEYSGYNFNAKTGKISVSGINTTRSATNREVVTYLIEAFEASPEFKNVFNRTFPLSESTDENGVQIYSLPFSMEMEIESGAFSKMNTPIVDLQAGEKVAKLKVPVKHNK